MAPSLKRQQTIVLSHLFHEMRCCILWNVEFNLKFCCVLADERCLFSSTCINNFHESLEQLIFLLLDRYLLKCSCKDTWLNCLTVTTGSYTINNDVRILGCWNTLHQCVKLKRKGSSSIFTSRLLTEMFHGIVRWNSDVSGILSSVRHARH